MIDLSRVRDLFWAAIEIKLPADSAEFLDRECRDNAELRAKIDALLTLLTAHEDAGSFLDTADADLDEAIQPTVTFGSPAAKESACSPGASRDTSVRIEGEAVSADDTAEGEASASTAVPAQNAAAGPVRRFGDYELLEEIARGGMGVVFKARQISLNRTVALKMILSGRLSGDEEIQRFHAEAEAAAKLDHPHIVPVYEVGQQDGRHFFSMGFVEGESLADRLKDGPLPPREAVALLKTIAEAIAYAHEKGIVHRDLKPSNVLLEVQSPESRDESQKEDRPQADVFGSGPSTLDSRPRITDFGLAKNIAADSGITTTGQILGTPSYMPPEQAAGKTEQIGPLSDVYSLGAVLYCLLTGRPPFQAANVPETLRQVLEQDPVSPRTLNPSVDRDLETICLKCLEKEPQRRFASATDLAAELNRFLAGEPIQARPVGRAERVWRWSRRNRLVAALSSTAVLLLIAVAVVGTVGYVQTTRALGGETEQRERAEKNALEARTAQRLAEENFQKARKVVDEFFTDVSESRELLKGTPGTQRLRKRLLERARKYYEDFTRNRAGDEKLQAALAAAHFRLALIAAETGEKPKALAAYRKAIEIFQRLARENPTVTEHQNQLAKHYNNIANLQKGTGKPAEALAAYLKALEIQQRLVRDNSTVTEYQNLLAKYYNNIAILQNGTGKPAEALAAYQKALEIQQRLARENPTVTEYQYNLAASYINIGILHRQTGEKPEALAAYERALEIHERLARENPAVTEYQSGLASNYNNIGVLHSRTSKRAEALAVFQKALAIQERLVRENPAVTEYQSDLASSYNNIGALHSRTGKRAEALAAYQKALEIRERLARDYPTVVDYAVRLGGGYVNQGNLVSETGKPEAALDWYRRGIETLEGARKRVPRHSTARLFLRNAHWGRAFTLDKLKRPAQAVADWERAIELDTGRLRQFFRSRLGFSLARAGDHVRAAREAKALAKAGKEKGSALYSVARIYSLSAAAAAQDKSLEQTKRAKLADEYALHAIDLLKRAQSAGFFKAAANVEQMKKDADLASLRMRADFKKLLSELQKNN